MRDLNSGTSDSLNLDFYITIHKNKLQINTKAKGKNFKIHTGRYIGICHYEINVYDTRVGNKKVLFIKAKIDKLVCN